MKGDVWRREEDAFLRKNFDSLTYEEMAERLGRTPEGTKMRCGQLGLRQRGGCMADNERDNAYMEKFWRELYGNSS